MTSPPAQMAMELKISQIILENVQFRHVGEYLAKERLDNPTSDALATIEVQHDADERRALVRLRVECDAPEAPYSYAVSYVILYTYEGDPPQDARKRLAVTGANMAYPFARELIANLSSRGRFGTTWLSPVNFNKVVEENQSAKKPKLPDQ